MGSTYEVNYHDDGIRCRTDDFLASLNKQCRAKANAMLLRLAEYGPALDVPQHAAPLRGGRNGLWELKGHCHKRAIRLYYWQSGVNEFTVACGELKEGREPKQSVLNFATRCYQEWLSSKTSN